MSQRKLRRLQRVRELTTIAIEKELEKLKQPVPTPSSPLGRQDVPETPPMPRRRRVYEVPEEVPPAPTRLLRSMPSTPGDHDRDRDEDIEADEAFRICRDTVLLMRCEELKESLRLQGLQLSGRKEELAHRLALEMMRDLQ